MKYLRLVILPIVASSLFLFSSCASYRAYSLNSPSSESLTFASTEQDDLVVAAKAFNKRDCK